MSKGALVSPFALAIELEVLAEFCAKFMYIRRRWSELVVECQAVEATDHLEL
jgi:hypothetical protein